MGIKQILKKYSNPNRNHEENNKHFYNFVIWKYVMKILKIYLI